MRERKIISFLIFFLIFDGQGCFVVGFLLLITNRCTPEKDYKPGKFNEKLLDQQVVDPWALDS